MVPIAGSAYTYAYASLGEFVAWIIGWDLIIEYAVGNIGVAIGWSGHFRELISHFGLSLPAWLATDYRTAYDAVKALAAGATDPNTAYLASAVTRRAGPLRPAGHRQHPGVPVGHVHHRPPGVSASRSPPTRTTRWCSSRSASSSSSSPSASPSSSPTTGPTPPPAGSPRTGCRASAPARPSSSSATSASTPSPPRPRSRRTPARTCRSASS